MDPTLVDLENLSIADSSASDPIHVRVPSVLVVKQGTKRKHHLVDQGIEEDTEAEVTGLSKSLKVADESIKRKNRVQLKHIRVSELVFPKSSYYGFEPPIPPSSERSVIQALLKIPGVRENVGFEGETFTSLNLEDFVIYRPSREQGVTTLAGEMVALHDFCVKAKNNIYYFDGVITAGTSRRYVQKIPFDYLSIGGCQYSDSRTVERDIWIQSPQGRNSSQADVLYRLGKPAPEYRRFHEPFLWLAEFSSHFVDYLKHNTAASLRMFALDFYRRLETLHTGDTRFRDWFKAYEDMDFRRVLAAHPRFFLNQALQLGDAYGSHPLWNEIHPKYLQAIPIQERSKSGKTMVTPYVYDCFKHLSWAHWLQLRTPSHLAFSAQSSKARVAEQVHDFPKNQELAAGRGEPHVMDQLPTRVGDVVKIARDEVSNWKGHDEFWYAYVQGIEEGRRGRGLRIIWLYRPSDTTCSDMRYPFKNELFLSDHCECDRHAIPVDEVAGKASVTFFGNPSSATDFFVRQRYTEEAFLDLRKEDFKCNCQNSTPHHGYQLGDTVLVLKRSAFEQPILEPVEIVELSTEGGKDSILVRRLLRKGRDFKDRDAEPNELVFTHQLEMVSISDIDRRCHIRFFSRAQLKEGKIPAPYCRQGTGDAYYIIPDETEPNIPLERIPNLKSLRQGFDPWKPPLIPKLKVMDLFCGGGNFGRGIEEGGAAEVKWAIDYDTIALHTYRANLANPEAIGLFLGSVNDYLAMAMQGNFSSLIARPGEVDMIIAGSPCQGFSNLNMKKSNAKGQRNQSMVAAVAAFIDFYRPKYALLENVLGMAHKKKDKNTFSQMLCSLVGMGYQVYSFSLDAWTFGSPQSRSRLFIAVTAPGLVPLGVLRLHILTLPTSRIVLWEQRQMEFHLEKETWKPSHQCHYRVTTHQNTESRLRLSCIPQYPGHKGLLYARTAGFMSEPLIDTYPSFFGNKKRSAQNSRTWQRTAANALMPTVAASCTPEDSHSGRLMHWEANRAMTLLEARRAQGQPDYEVIVGSAYQQWKVVGNSVARTVALALGMSLRAAWLANSDSEFRRNDAREDQQLTAQITWELEKATIDGYSPSTLQEESHIPSTTRAPDLSLTQPALSYVDSTAVSEDDIFVPIPSSSPSTVGRKPASVEVMQPSASTVSNQRPLPVKERRVHTTSKQEVSGTIEISSDSESDVLLIARPTPHNSRRRAGRENRSTNPEAHKTIIEETTTSETRIIETTTIRRETLIPSSRVTKTVAPDVTRRSRRPMQTLGNDGGTIRGVAAGASPEIAIEID